MLADAALGLSDSNGVLTDILRDFTGALNGGADKIVAAEAALCSTLLCVQFLVMVVKAGFDPSSLKTGIFQLLGCYGWYLLATNAVAVTSAWTEYCGSAAAFYSSGINGDVMNNPSVVVELAFKADDMLVAKALGYPNPFTAILAIIIYSFCGILLTIGMALMGLTALVVKLMASINIVVGLMLLPFIIEQQTRSFAGTGIGMIISSGLSLAATSITIGLCYSRIEAPLPQDPGFGDAMLLALKADSVAFICFVVSWKSWGATASVGFSKMFG